MTRRRAVSAFVCSVFLFLIAMTARSLYGEIDGAEAMLEHASEADDSPAVATYTSGYRSRDESRDRIVRVERPDAGVPDLFTRELTACVRTDCWSRRHAGDSGVYFLPPCPPKVR